jgi:hypothetical protein
MGKECRESKGRPVIKPDAMTSREILNAHMGFKLHGMLAWPSQRKEHAESKAQERVAFAGRQSHFRVFHSSHEPNNEPESANVSPVLGPHFCGRKPYFHGWICETASLLIHQEIRGWNRESTLSSTTHRHNDMLKISPRC